MEAAVTSLQAQIAEMAQVQQRLMTELQQTKSEAAAAAAASAASAAQAEAAGRFTGLDANKLEKWFQDVCRSGVLADIPKFSGEQLADGRMNPNFETYKRVLCQLIHPYNPNVVNVLTQAEKESDEIVIDSASDTMQASQVLQILLRTTTGTAQKIVGQQMTNGLEAWRILCATNDFTNGENMVDTILACYTPLPDKNPLILDLGLSF